MKILYTLALLLLAIVSSPAQQVFIDPSSVTLTQPGIVTVIDTDTKGSSEGGSSATVGTLTATYTNYVSGYAANQGFNYLGFSASTTGTLSAGTYSVTTHNNPKQVTVILWNESANSAFAISQVELAYDSASTSDQEAFQTFIEALVQERLASLQTQITALQQSNSQQNSDITALQQQLSSLQSSHDALTNELTTLQERLAALESHVAGLPVTNGGNSTNGTSGENHTIAYVGVGLGAAGVIGAILNAAFDSKPETSSENH